MPLFDFTCNQCKRAFEQLTDSRGMQDPEAGTCPHCGATGATRQPPRIRIGGQGDLRESTMHGCHDQFDGVSHDHSHEHSHGSEGHDHD